MLAKIKFILLRRIMWAVSLIGTFTRRRTPLPDPMNVRRIAVIQFGGIGDMVLTTAALRELARGYPSARITIVCSRRSHAEFLSNFPFVEEIVAFNIYGLDSRSILRRLFWTELGAILERLRSARFDLLVNLHNPFLIDWYLIEFLLVALSRSRFSVGVNPSYLPRPSVYHRWVSEDLLEGKHYQEFFLDVIELLGIHPHDRQTVFPLDEKEVVFAQTLLDASTAQGRAIAVIHPGSSAPHNRWPVERYAALSLALSESGLRVFVIGSEADRYAGKAMSRTNPQVQDLTGKTTLCQTAALIGRAAVFIGNDSSQFHVAVAVNTPAVGLIGGGSPRFHLYQRENIRVIRKPIDCAPCRDRTCQKMECMKEIRVDEVVAAVDGLLTGAQERSPLPARASPC